MIKTEVVKEIERLLREENLSQRKIARLTGVARGTIATIAAGRRPDYEQLRLEREDTLPEPDGPLRRCFRCGALVQLPCMACHIRQLTEIDKTIPRFTGEEPPLKLELRGKHRQRYEEVRRQRELADAQAEVKVLADPVELDEGYELTTSDVLDAFEAEYDEDTAECQAL